VSAAGDVVNERKPFALTTRAAAGVRFAINQDKSIAAIEGGKNFRTRLLTLLSTRQHEAALR
jgi:hypothetical protein